MKTTSGQDALTTRPAPFDLPLKPSPDYGDDILDHGNKLAVLLYGDSDDQHTLVQRDYLIRAVNSFDDMLAALKAIRNARDYCAEHGKYPENTLAPDQEFDDWAADVSAAAIAKAGGQ